MSKICSDLDLTKVQIVIGVDGRKDIYRPGSVLFGTLAPIPPEIARQFTDGLPAEVIPEVLAMQRAAIGL